MRSPELVLIDADMIGFQYELEPRSVINRRYGLVENLPACWLEPSVGVDGNNIFGATQGSKPNCVTLTEMRTRESPNKIKFRYLIP